MPDSRKPEVSFGDSIEVDLSRRDFTVNAMALRLPDLELVDPYDGLADLAAHRLRTPLAPEISFGDDPLRMLRAARFIAGFGLEPAPEITAAVKVMHDRLSIVSAERIRDELDKLVVGRQALAGAVVHRRDGPGRRVPPRASRASPSSRTPSTATKTSSPTPWPWWTRRARTACCAWPPCSTTSASPAPGPSAREA